MHCIAKCTLALLFATSIATPRTTDAATAETQQPSLDRPADGVVYGFNALLQYDLNTFAGESAPRDRSDWRRATLGMFARRKDVFDMVANYDLKFDAWIDAYVRVHTQAGALRIGQFRTPVGLDDGATSSGGTLFLERAAPEAAIHQGRRIGLDWTRAIGTRWLFNVGAYHGGDLNGLHDGRSVAGRAVLTPRNDVENLMHFGVASSREHRDDETARIHTRPEAALTDRFTIDSGVLRDSRAIDRHGVEAIWRHGPWALQSEWLGISIDRRTGLGDVRAHGSYLQGSWMLSGETKPYRNGALQNPRPQRASGAVELAMRYSRLHIDALALARDHQRNWAIGLNWYVGTRLKLMANYIDAESRGRPDLHVVGLRVQLML